MAKLRLLIPSFAVGLRHFDDFFVSSRIPPVYTCAYFERDDMTLQRNWAKVDLALTLNSNRGRRGLRVGQARSGRGGVRRQYRPHAQPESL